MESKSVIILLVVILLSSSCKSKKLVETTKVDSVITVVQKVELAKRWALEIDPYLKIQVFSEGVQDSNIEDYI